MRQRAVGKSADSEQKKSSADVDHRSKVATAQHASSSNNGVRRTAARPAGAARPSTQRWRLLPPLLAAVAVLALALIYTRPHAAAAFWQFSRSSTGRAHAGHAAWPATGGGKGSGVNGSGGGCDRSGGGGDGSGGGGGELVYGPSLGVFPRGCRWREVVRRDRAAAAAPPTGAATASVAGAAAPLPDSPSQSANSSVGTLPFDPPRYQYWDDSSRAWSDRQPPACRLRAVPNPGPPGWRFLNGTPRTEVTPHAHHTEYRNLWYNNGRWYALVDGPRPVSPWRASRNVEITPLHVADASAFAAAVNWSAAPGDTLLIDYAFFTHPTAIGHWWELLAPLYSVLRGANASAAAAAGGGGGGDASAVKPPDAVVLLHFERRHLAEWARAVLAAALGVAAPGAPLPPIALQERAPNKYAQITMPLEGVPAGRWVVFERVLAARDVFTGGGRTFANADDARAFRAAVYALYGLPPPAKRAPPPRAVTFQRKRANRRLTNEADVLAALADHGDVRVVEFDAWTPFAAQLQVIASTGLLASAHTSNLANAPLLQPGSVVVEFIPRHWSWLGLDRSFKEQTVAMGDLHHYAWRANRANESVYIRPSDARKFAAWRKSACAASEPCVEAQTLTDLTVDVAALRALLQGRMPLVAAGASVADAELPWPPEL